MPPVLAAITAIGSAISGALATTYLGIQLGTWIAGSLLVYGQVSANRARKKARAAYNDGLTDRMVTFTDANAPWQVVYGETVVGGRIVAQLTSGDRDQYQHVVVVWADHECDSLQDTLLAGEPLGALDSSGYVTSGKYYKPSRGTPSLSVTLDSAGSTTLATAPESVLGLSYNTSSEAYGSEDVVLPGSELTVAGTVVTVKPAHVAQWAGRTVQLSYRSGDANALVRVRHHLGAPGQVADTMTIAECPGAWSTTDRLAGKCYSVFRFNLDEPEFQGGPPLMQVRLRGKKLYDHRTDTTAWSANNALCVADFLLGEYGKAQPSNALLWSSFDAAANVCDEDVTRSVGGVATTGKRYTCNGAFTTDADPDDTLTALCQSMAGFATFGGAWHVQAGVYTFPWMALTDADNLGGVEVIECPEGQEMVNGMRGQFYDRDRFGQRTDYLPYRNSAFVADDGGEAFGSLNLPFTDSNWRAHNLARIQVERSRGQQVIYPAKLRALRLRVGQRVTLTNAMLNLDAAVYRVVKKNFRIGGPVMLTLAQDDATMYDETDAPAALPSPTAPTRDPWVVDDVVGLTALSNEAVVVRDDDGTVISRARLAWAATADPYVLTSGALQVEVRLAAALEWTRLPEVSPAATSVPLPGLQDRRYYLVRARWRNGLGQVGAWVSLSLITAAPSALSTAGVTGALLAAAAAQDAADAANAALSDIANDNLLTRYEKPKVVLDHMAISEEQAGIDARAAAYGITTERTAYNAAVTALGSYLSGLSPAWNDSTQNTPIVRATFQAAFALVYSTRQVLLNKVAEVAGLRAAWATVAGRPADDDILNARIPISKGTMNADPGCEYLAAWLLSGGAELGVTNGWPAVGRGLIRFPAGALNSQAFSAEQIPVSPGRRYRLSARLQGQGGNDRNMYVTVRMYRADNTELDGSHTGWGGSYAGYVFGGLPSVGSWGEQGADFGAGTALPIPAEVSYLRVGVWGQYSYGTSSLSQWAQDVRLVEVTDLRTAQATADAAQTALAAIASDNMLTRGEKPVVVLDWTTISNERAGIESRGIAYGLSTEVSAYNGAVTALAAYLDGLTPTWSDLSQDTPIIGSALRGAFGAVYSTRQVLLNRIAEVAGTLASWAGVSGAGKPASWATVGKSLGLPFDSWVLNGHVLATVSDGKVGSQVLRLRGHLGNYPNQGNFVAIDRSKKYRTRFWARPSSGADGLLYFSLRQFTAASLAAEGPVNSGRSPYKPSVQTKALHDAAFGAGQWGEYSHVWVAADWQAGVQFVQPEFLDNHGGSTDQWWEVQDFSFEEVTEVLVAQAAADAAATAAGDAQADADTANTALAAIANDDVLTRGEKPAVILDWTTLSNEQAGIDAQATAYGITTEKTAYDTALSTLGSYLAGLSPAWNSLSVDTPITGSAFRTYFANVYTLRQVLLNRIAAVAGTVATWSGVTGAGRPADGATVNRVTYSASAPGSPVDGDVWVDTSGSPAVIKLRVGGAWQAGANLSTGALAQLNAVLTQHIAIDAATEVGFIFDADGFQVNGSGST